MLTELLVVIAIIALLVSILMPTLQKAKDLSKDLICATNQRAIATALHMYARDFDEQIPINTFF